MPGGLWPSSEGPSDLFRHGWPSQLPYGGQLGFTGVQLGGKGHVGWFAGLRRRCGDSRAAAGACRCASLLLNRGVAAAAVRPCVRPGPRSPPPSFPQVTCLVRSDRPVLASLFVCGMRGRPALTVLAWSGDGSPVRGCTTTSGDRVPSDTLTHHERLFLGMPDGCL